ncbi:hypothetical protein RUND412_004742 [Rhizina undulata]
MNALPAEILQEIVSYLIGPDLDSLRLVSRRLSAVAAIFKFRALRVCVTRRGLDNLLNVSRQPELARYVREITYPHNLLAPMPESNLVEDQRYPGEPSEYKPFLTRFFEWCNDHYVAQAELENSGECLRTLETALPRMANIRVIIPGHFNYSVHSELYRKWLRTLTEKEMNFVSKMSNIYSDIILDRILLEEGDQTQVLKAVMDLVNTAHRLGYKLDRFDRGHAGMWYGIFSKSSGLWSCASLFQNLTSLDVCISTSLTKNTLKDTTAIKQDAKEGRIHKFVSFAPNLRKLFLQISGCLGLFTYPAVGNPAISLLDILGHGYVWRHLHTFHLASPYNSEDLIDFLGRHASTLKYLQFHWSSTLLNGTWREIMDFLKERIHLTDLYLQCAGQMVVDGNGRPRERYISKDEQDKMKDYVLRGGTPFPPTKMELDENRREM